MLDLAQYMGEKIKADETFELLAPVNRSAICFRLRDVDDATNELILAKLVEEGTALLGPVKLHGRFGMRACITNFRTRKEDIDLILERIRRIAAVAVSG